VRRQTTFWAAPPRYALHSGAPNIITDGMDPIRSMADGRTYDSRSRYYGSLKAQGCEIVGNDRAWLNDQPKFEPRAVGPDIKRAIQELESR